MMGCHAPCFRSRREVTVNISETAVVCVVYCVVIRWACRGFSGFVSVALGFSKCCVVHSV